MATIVTRGGKGSALTHAEGDANFNNLNTDKVEADDVRTFSNKSIDLATNTVTGTTAEFNAALSDNDFATQDGAETLTNKTLTSPTLNTPTITTPDINGGTADSLTSLTVTASAADGAKDSLRLQVNGITALRALTPVSGERVYLTYHTTEGDGGHGVFRGITGAAPGTYTDDNGVTIVPTGGDGSAALVRVYDGEIEAAWFGLSPAATAENNTTAITAAISFCGSTGGVINIPPGSFNINSFNLTSGITLNGAGRADYVSTPTFTGTTLVCSSGYAITLSGTSGTSPGQKEHVQISNLTIDGASKTGNGIKFYNFRYCKISNVHITGCSTAFLVGRDLATDVSYGLVLRDMLIEGCTNAIDADASADTVFVDAVNVSLRGISGKGVSGAFVGTWIGGFIGGSSVGTNNALFYLNGSQNFTVMGTAIENIGSVAGTTKDFSIGATTQCQSINIIGVLTSVSSASFGRSHSIDVINCYGGQITGCQISSGGSDAAAFIGINLGTSANNILVSGNRDEGITGSKVMLAVDATASANCFAMHNGLVYSSFTMEVSTGLQQLLKFQRNGDSVQRCVVNSDGKIEWGSGAATRDTNLYRQSADLLRTDDKFAATSGLGVGNSAAATTLGSVTKKMEVFNETGTSLGFVPIYDAIT